MSIVLVLGIGLIMALVHGFLVYRTASEHGNELDRLDRVIESVTNDRDYFKVAYGRMVEVAIAMRREGFNVDRSDEPGQVYPINDATDLAAYDARERMAAAMVTEHPELPEDPDRW